MKVYVVTGNDFPDAVFKNEAAAEKYCRDKLVETQKFYGFKRIYWSTNEFDLREDAP